MRFLVLIASLLSAVVTMAAEPLTAQKFFADAPLEVLDMLRPSARLDMLDYYNQADSLVGVQNALGGMSRLEKVSDDYLKVKVTPVSTLEIKILPYKGGDIAMTLYTVGGDSIAKDTDVKFFDRDMKPLPADKFLKKPDAKSFFNLKDSEISPAEFAEWMPFQTMEITTGPGEAPLVMSLTTLRTLPSERRELLAPLLVPSLSATWTGSKFNYQNP